MNELDLVYRNIRIRINCDKNTGALINEFLLNHIMIDINSCEIPTYSLVIGDDIDHVQGDYYKMIDKWFDNATLDCFIDNKNKICYVTNIRASSIKYKDLLIQYFVSNFLNRFLEIKGYLGVHSSCVEKDNNGILFVAGRFNGKTNCMLNMMNEGFNSVTNDKIALKRSCESVIGYGIAQSVSVRLGPSFCSQPQNKKYVDIALSRGIIIKDADMLEGNKIEFNDNELASLNNVKQVMESKINCIIQPFYDSSLKKPIFKKLSNEQLMDLVISQYMSLVHDTTIFLRNIRLDDNEDIKRKITLDFLHNIPSYACYQNEHTREEFVDKVKKLSL